MIIRSKCCSAAGADAMRRQALVPLHHHFRTRRTAEARLLDVASGTGRFLTFVKDNYPRLDVTALDLSPNYLARPGDCWRPGRVPMWCRRPPKAFRRPMAASMP